VYISFDQVREGPVRWEETLEVPLASLAAPELLGISPVRCRGLVTFVDPAFHLHADLSYGQKLQCDRCLQEFEQQVEASCDLVLEQAGGGQGSRTAVRSEPHGHRAPGDRLDTKATDGGDDAEPAGTLLDSQLEEDDLGVVRVTGDEVSTEPLVAEQVVLNLPMKPLCKPDCAGLCASCGADLNVEPCNATANRPATAASPVSRPGSVSAPEGQPYPHGRPLDRGLLLDSADASRSGPERSGPGSPPELPPRSPRPASPGSPSARLILRLERPHPLERQGTEEAMPNPKRRHSKARRDRRRAHDALAQPAKSVCPSCGEVKLPHRACPSCGEYKNREVIEGRETL
jgi:large subunit ribosomal protein L32